MYVETEEKAAIPSTWTVRKRRYGRIDDNNGLSQDCLLLLKVVESMTKGSTVQLRL
jgi:hypothetical protein